MSIWRHLTHGFRALTNRASTDQEISDEVEHFLREAEASHRARGLSAAEAQRAARLELGNSTAVREEVRSYGWENVVTTLSTDVRYAVRRLRNNPGFTLVAVMSLALGIGANTAIFSLVNATLIRTLPVPDPDELVYVNSASGAFSYPDFAELREHSTLLDKPLIAWGGISASINTGNSSELVSGLIVTGDFFNVLQVKAAKGRAITPDDDRTPGAHPVVVISDRYWKRSFGAREDIVGQDVRFNGHRFTIIGVMPEGFEGPVMGVPRDLYVPMMMQAVARPPRGGYSGEMNPDLLGTRGNRWLFVAARLPESVSPEQLHAQLNSVVAEQNRRNPTDPQGAARGATASIVRIDDPSVNNREQVISVSRLLMTIVGAVLLIACLNVANLLLARASARRKEVAVRLAIGASRKRLVRQLLTESMVLSVAGGIAGLGLAWASIAALRASPPPPGALPIAIDFAIDTRVLLFTLVLSLVTGMVFGLVPAFRASRPDLVPALKDQVNQERVRRFSGRNALVVLQVGLSLVILVAAGLFLRSFQRTQGVSPGFETDRIATASVNINLLRYTSAQGRRFYRELIDRVEALPGVESAALSRWLPLTGGGSVRSVQIEGAALNTNTVRNDNAGTGRAPGTTNMQTVSVNYLQTLGIQLLGGRNFTARDDSGSTLVAIVNEAFAAEHFPAGDVVGKRFNSGAPGAPYIEIIGIARNTKLASLSEAPQPLVYVPLLQNHETGVVLHVRSSTESPAPIVAQVRSVLQSMEPNLPVPGVRLLSETLSASLYPARAGARLLVGFGVLALLLASIGLYGVMSYSVSRRTRDLGIRMALGARPGRILRQIVSEGTLLVAMGMLIGLAFAFYLTRLLTSFLFGISPTDPGTYIATLGLLMLVAIGASFVPALRATRIDPLQALREE